MNFNVEFTTSEQDFVKINHELRKKNRTGLSMILGILTPFILIIGGVYFVYLDIFVYKKFPTFGLLAIWFVIFSNPLINILSGRTFKRIYRSNKIFLESKKITFTEEAIREVSESSNSVFKWDSIFTFIELKDFIYLGTSSITFIAIPKNIMNNEQVEWVKNQYNSNRKIL